MQVRGLLGLSSLLLIGGCALVVHFGDYTDAGSGGHGGGTGGASTNSSSVSAGGSTSSGSTTASTSTGATCTTATDCQGMGSECAPTSCVKGVCSVSFAPAGTPSSIQIPGDCQVAQCDGQGNLKQAADNMDIPPDDGNPCTAEGCAAGTPTHTITLGASCGGSLVCDNSGHCSGCASSADCPAAGPCFTWSCVAGDGGSMQCVQTALSGPCGTPAGCTNGVDHSADTCVGTTCVPGNSTSCGAYACAGAHCANTCVDPSDCAPGYTCPGGQCCVTCSDWSLGTGRASQICVNSQSDLDTLRSCACGSCLACQTACQSDLPVTPQCTACMQTKCNPELNACMMN